MLRSIYIYRLPTLPLPLLCPKVRTGAASLAPGTRDFEGSGARNAYIGNPGLLRAVEHRTRLIPKAEKSGRSDRLLAPPPSSSPPSSNSIERSGGVDSNRSCRRIKKGRLFYLAQGQVWNSSQLILRSTAKRRGRDEKKFSSYLPPCRFTFSSPGRKKMEIAARFEARLRETRNTRNLIFLPSFGHLRNGSPNGPSPDLLSSFSRNQFARVKFLPFPFLFFSSLSFPFLSQRFEEPSASWERVEEERKNVVDRSFYVRNF